MFKPLRNRYDQIFLLILLAGSLLRFWNYAGWSLSNDELSALARLQYQDFYTMVEEGVRKTDMHPMGVQSFLWIWTHCFGITEAAVRFPFVLAGIGSMLFLYLSAARIFGKATALYAGALFAALGFPILFSQLARPYSPGLLFTLVMTLGWAQLVFRKEQEGPVKWQSWLLFIVGGTACMYSHYFSFLQAALLGLSGLFLIEKKLWLRYFLAGLFMFVLYIPNYTVFVSQFSIGGLGGAEGWLGPPGRDAVWAFLVYAFNQSVGFLLFVFMFAGFLWWKSGKPYGLDLRQKIVLLLFAIPVLIAYYYSVYANPVFQYSILLFCFPFLLLFLFSVLKEERIKLPTPALAFFLLLVTVCSTVWGQGFYSRQFFAPFREVAQRIVDYRKKFGPDKSDVTVNVINPWYIHYYTDRMEREIPFKQYIANMPSQWEEYRQLVADSKSETFIHGWCNNYHAPELDMITREKFPYLVARDTFFNAGVMVYSRNPNWPVLKQADTLFSYMTGYENLTLEGEEKLRDSSASMDGRYSLHIFPDTEYGPTLRRKCSDVGLRTSGTFELSCAVYPLMDLKDATAVVSINRGTETSFWRGVRLKEYKMQQGFWNAYYMAFKLTEEVKPDDELVVYFYNPGKEQFLVDDFCFLIRP